MMEWGREKEKLCWDGVQDLPATEIRKRGEGKPALPAKTAGKIIKRKVFPVSVPSGEVLLRPLL